MSGPNPSFLKSVVKSIEAITLIRLVKEHPVLFDRAHPHHLDAQVSAVVWGEISQGLIANYHSYDESAKTILKQMVQKRWKGLRYNFLKFLKQSGPKKAKKMSAKNQELHFLVPFLMNESASASYEVHHGDADISDDAEETTSAVSSGLEPPFSPGTKKSDFMIEIVADMKPLTLVEKKQLKDLILLVALQQKTANELLIDEEPPAASSTIYNTLDDALGHMSLTEEEQEELDGTPSTSSGISHDEDDMTFATTVTNHMADLGAWDRNDVKIKILMYLNNFIFKYKNKPNKK